MPIIFSEHSSVSSMYKGKGNVNRLLATMHRNKKGTLSGINVNVYVPSNAKSRVIRGRALPDWP